VHELSLAQAVWRQVEAEMARRPGARLRGLDLVVGAFSGADPDSLGFAMEVVVAGSAWKGAAVRVRREDLAMRCTACGREFVPDGLDLACPACGSAETDPVRGTEVRLVSLEVEDALP